ncbi:hypothetical protein CDD81_4865 [Ophiocordyceps australis]|uniref:Uncharacterized protein n=1 Tax=Ophiocordyceps australis TaxID=1399860 RepID=A0A2C5YBJ8_9HYPO|nr:hypothetical protein CDD81_4865 [Ophiocordyceps australis]
MGLPLFVAPVESQLPPKAESKDEATPSTRSAMRRAAIAEARAARRRALRTSNGLIPPISSLPWIEERDRRTWDQRINLSGDEASNLRNHTTRMALETLLRRASANEPQSPDLSSADAASPRLLRLRSSISQRMANTARHDDHLVPTDRLARMPRSRLSQQRPPRFDRSPEHWRSFQFSPSHPPRTRLGAALDDYNGLAPRGGTRDAHPRRTTNQGSAVERAFHSGLDGLGDRDRSPPANNNGPDGDCDDMWDEFLSMVSPDPQPPSANSSFAPAMASRRLGSSTAGMPRSAPSITDDTLAEVQCDSGCENSDHDLADEGEEEQTVRREYAARLMAVQEIQRQHDARRAAEGSFRFFRRPPTPMDRYLVSQHGDDADSARSRRSNETGGQGAAPRGAFLDRVLNQSAETLVRTRRGSLEDFGNSSNETSQLSRERSTLTDSETSAGTLGVEEDWPGMQRIVRSLARREDIPDEWWAEAGLSRILPHGELPS